MFVEVHPVQPGEVRIVTQGKDGATARRVTQANRSRRPMLPPGTLASTQGFKLVTLGLDQGAVGAAATAFADHMQQCVILPMLHSLIGIGAEISVCKQSHGFCACAQ